MNDGAHPCPICAETLFDEAGSYGICEVCGWEDDPLQLEDPDYQGGANKESLNQARRDWVEKKLADE